MYRRYKAQLLGQSPPKAPVFLKARTKSNLTNNRSVVKAKSFIRSEKSFVAHINHVDDDDMRQELKEKAIELIKGNCKILYPENAKIVRIFTSSTFTDTRHERNTLMENVYPELKKFCKEYGYEFQVVDMRWGVRDESSNDHTTTELCMKELDACQKLSTGPNFITFLSHKYGYRPFPRIIEAVEFENILSAVENEERKSLLQKWFKKDENAVPVSYILQPISTYLPDYLNKDDQEKFNNAKNTWWEFNDMMAESLAHGATKTLNEQRKHAYLMSVTENEITEGILKARGTDKHCFWFYRDIKDIEEQPKSNLLSRYMDIRGPEETVKEAQNLLKDLKRQKIPRTLPPENIVKFDVNWSDNAIDPNNVPEHKQYIKQLSSSFESTLKKMIQDGISEKKKDSFSQPLYEEILQHVLFLQQKCENFYGREEIFVKLHEYVLSDGTRTSPFIVHGESGSGKTSIMAVAANRCLQWLDSKAVVIFRFIGITQESSNLRSLLHSILSQIQDAYEIVPSFEDNDEGKDLSSMNLNELRKTMNYVLTKQIGAKKIAKGKPLILILDSLDQLNLDGNPQDLEWLPSTFKKHVRVVLSTLPDNDKTKYGYLPRLQSLYANEPVKFLQLSRMPESDVNGILKRWLDKRRRRLTPSQMKIILNAFDQCPVPLYLNICMEEAMLWSSYQHQETTVLENTIETAIIKLFKRIERSHGSILTSHTLAYITAARNGLSEAELEDILACDDDVLNDVYQFWVPPVRRLPPLLLVRMRADLQQYMVDRGSDGVKVIYWYHRQFIEVAKARYLTDKGNDYRKKIHRAIAEFFLGTWADTPKPFVDKKGQQDSKPRLVANQPNKFKDTYNVRKFMEGLLHMIKAKMTKELEEEVFYNLAWLTDKLKATSFYDVVSDFKLAMESLSPEEIDLDSIEYMLSILRLSQNALSDDPSQLPAQFLGRSEKSLPGIDRFRSQCLKSDYPVLIPCQVCLTSPGGDLNYQLDDHTDIVSSIDITQDGKYAVTCSADETIKIWNVENQTLERSVSVGKVEKVRLCFDDKYILASGVKSNDKIFLKCIEFATGVTMKLPGPFLHMDFTVFGEGKTKVALITQRFCLKVLDVNSWDVVQGPTIDPNSSLLKDNCFSVVLDASKDIIAIGYENVGWFRIYNLSKKEFLPKIKVYKKPAKNDVQECVDALAVSSDAKWVVVSSFGHNNLDFFDTQTGAHLRTIQGSKDDMVAKFKLFDNDKLLIFPNVTNICFWNLETGEKEYKFKHSLNITDFVTYGERQWFWTTATDNVLRIWDKNMETKGKVQSTKSNKTWKKVYCQRILPYTGNSRYLLLHLSKDSIPYLEIYDIIQEKVVRSYQVQGTFTGRSLHMIKGDMLVLEAAEMVHLIDLKTGKIVRTLSGKIPKYDSDIVVLHKTNAVIVAGNKDVNVYSLEDGELVQTMKSERKQTNLRVNKDETVAITSSGTYRKSVILVYDLKTYQLQHTLKPSIGIPEVDLSETIISDDGHYLIHINLLSSKPDEGDLEDFNGVIVWDLWKGELLQQLFDQPAMLKYMQLQEEEYDDIDPNLKSPEVCVISLLQDSKVQLLQGSEDGIIRVFDPVSGELLKKVTTKHHNGISYITHITNQQTGTTQYIVSSSSSDNTMHIYNADTWEDIASFKTESTSSRVTLLGNGSIILSVDHHGSIITWKLNSKENENFVWKATDEIYDHSDEVTEIKIPFTNTDKSKIKSKQRDKEELDQNEDDMDEDDDDEDIGVEDDDLIDDDDGELEQSDFDDEGDDDDFSGMGSEMNDEEDMSDIQSDDEDY